jgi:hypothetical protein
MKFTLLIASLLIGLIASAQTYVKGYTKKNGTYVAPHYRSSPNSTKSDNYSTKGNVNPYTGKAGTKTDNSYNTYSTPSYSQDEPAYADWSSYRVDYYYVKVELPAGTLDTEGNEIYYVYKKVEAPKVGTYNVSISDADGDLFEIKDVDVYIKFVGYHGYAGYSEEGILKIESFYSSTYYKKP